MEFKLFILPSFPLDRSPCYCCWSLVVGL